MKEQMGNCSVYWIGVCFNMSWLNLPVTPSNTKWTVNLSLVPEIQLEESYASDLNKFLLQVKTVCQVSRSYN